MLYIDRIQPDPYAPPTAIRVVLPLALTGADARLTGFTPRLTGTNETLTEANEPLTDAAAHLTASPTRAVALRDYLARTLRELLKGQAISIARQGRKSWSAPASTCMRPGKMTSPPRPLMLPAPTWSCVCAGHCPRSGAKSLVARLPATSTWI